jgi:hypothetical protein
LAPAISRFAVLVLTGLLLAGCAGTRATTAPQRPKPSPAVEQFLADQLAHRSPPVVPSGYRVRHVSEAGFSIAFPAGWQVLERRDAVWPGTISTLARVDRGLAPYLSALVVPDTPLKLVGFDRRDTGATATVLVSTGAGRGWANVALAGVRQLPAVRGLYARLLPLPAGRALFLRYGQDFRGRRLSTLQLFVERNGRILTLTLSAPPARAGAYARTFLAVARSVDLSVEILHP